MNPTDKTFRHFRLSHFLTLPLAMVLALGARGQDSNTNAPVLLSASALDNVVQVGFSLPVQPATATNVGNYSLSNLYGSVAILAAAPGSNSQTIQLTTARQLPFMAHYLDVSGVADAQTGSNVMGHSQAVYTNLAFTTGYLRSEFYLGIPGTTLSALTNSPRFPDAPNRVSYPVYSYWYDSTVGANYGNRMSGILVPSASGFYTFSIYTPGTGLLSLSTNDNPAAKQAISSCQSQVFVPSQPIRLEAGRHYYLEGLSKEGSSPGDFAELIWTTPDYPNGWALIPMENLGNYLVDPAASIRVARQPADASVYDDRRATFSIDAVGISKITTNLNYQWQLNGTDVPGATDASYTTPLVYDTNSGAAYRVLVYLPGTALFSRSARLSVTQDLTPPTVTQAFNFGLTQIQLLFSEEVEWAGATNLENYALGGGPAITAASLDSLGMVVTLTTAPMAYGSNYTLLINGVRDRAMTPNMIATNTTVAVSVQPLASQDIGSPPLASITTPASGGLDVAASGNDLGGTADQLNLNYQLCAGDFDVCVRLAGLSLSDLWAKAGVMARESLGAGSRFAAVLATPSMNGGGFQYPQRHQQPRPEHGELRGELPRDLASAAAIRRHDCGLRELRRPHLVHAGGRLFYQSTQRAVPRPGRDQPQPGAADDRSVPRLAVGGAGGGDWPGIKSPRSTGPVQPQKSRGYFRDPVQAGATVGRQQHGVSRAV